MPPAIGIVSYDPEVQAWRGGKQAKPIQEEEIISTVQVRLLQSVQISPAKHPSLYPVTVRMKSPHSRRTIGSY